MEGHPPNDFCSVCMEALTFLAKPISLIGSAITLLVPVEASLRERHNPTVAEVLEKVEKYNRYFGGQSNSLIQVFLSGIYNTYSAP